MRRFAASFLLLVAVAVASVLTFGAGDSSATLAGGYQVIVHPDNPLAAVERSFLEDVFLKKVTRWPSREATHPVDLVPRLPARHHFSRHVLDRSVAAVRAYWRQRIFSGRGVPPPELGSENATVAYVLEHPGAVGYVSIGTELEGCKVLAITR